MCTERSTAILQYDYAIVQHNANALNRSTYSSCGSTLSPIPFLLERPGFFGPFIPFKTVVGLGIE